MKCVFLLALVVAGAIACGGGGGGGGGGGSGGGGGGGGGGAGPGPGPGRGPSRSRGRSRGRSRSRSRDRGKRAVKLEQIQRRWADEVENNLLPSKFQAFDVNEDGKITIDEFVETLNIPLQKAKELLKIADNNEDEMVSCQEFVEAELKFDGEPSC